MEYRKRGVPLGKIPAWSRRVSLVLLSIGQRREEPLSCSHLSRSSPGVQPDPEMKTLLGLLVDPMEFEDSKADVIVPLAGPDDGMYGVLEPWMLKRTPSDPVSMGRGSR